MKEIKMSSIDKNTKTERATSEQLAYFVEFCKWHPELTPGKNKPRASSHTFQLWWELAGELNSMRGPKRTPSKWKISLMQWKHKIDSRARKKEMRQTLNSTPQILPEVALDNVDDLETLQTRDLNDDMLSVQQNNNGNLTHIPTSLTEEEQKPTADELHEIEIQAMQTRDRNEMFSVLKDTDRSFRSILDVNGSSPDLHQIRMQTIQNRDRRDEEILIALKETNRSLKTIADILVKLNEKIS